MVFVIICFDSLKLKLSTEKTVFIIFLNKPYSTLREIKLNINGSFISSSETMRYLGVILDSLAQHARYIIDKAIKLLNIIKMLRGT